MSGLRKYSLLGIVIAVVVGLDLWTKALIRSHFHWAERMELIAPVFGLTYVGNRGAAFSFMDDAPASIRDPFFIVVPILALVGIFLYYRKLHARQRLTALCLSLIAGGAIGNLYDRLHYGFVTDFLDLHWKEVYHWPRFNVADSCIVVGVSILFLQSLFAKPTAPT